jgi:anion-transporting  ArsA/GET3 family ATPase
VAHQAARIEDTITDRGFTGVAIVAAPEEMAVNESGSLATALPRAGLALDAIYVNGLYPQRFSAAELCRIDEVRRRAVAGGPAEAALGAALTEAERVKAQHAELDRLRQLVPSIPSTELPFLFSADFGADELELLAGEIS